MKTVPANDFAIVRDIERDMIVDVGNYGQCIDQAQALNNVYQSVAYVAERWRVRGDNA